MLSSDGRFVIFGSATENRHPGNPEWAMDIVVYDRLTAKRMVIPGPRYERPVWNYTYVSSVSADGRFVAFGSSSDRWVAGDKNSHPDGFLHDRLSGETTLVSLSTDGRQGNGGSTGSILSSDGRYLAFASGATNFVGPDLNRDMDVFLRDRETGFTTLISRASDGTPGDRGSGSPSISADGRYIVFSSTSTNLVGGDTNGETDVFVHDRATGETERVSVATDGTQAKLGASGGSISADGRLVVFLSNSDNLVAGDTNRQRDVFVHDRLTLETTRVSVASDGSEANGASSAGSISGDGRFVAFESRATNLVADDTNALADVFLHDRLTGETLRMSLDADGNQGRIGSSNPSIAANGRYVVFYSADLGGIVVYDRSPTEPDAWLPTATPPPTATMTVSATAVPSATTTAPGPSTRDTPGPPQTETPSSAPSGRGGCGAPLVAILAAAGLATVSGRRARLTPETGPPHLGRASTLSDEPQ